MDSKKSPMDGFSAEDVFQHVYPSTILAAVKDIDKQIDDYHRYLKDIVSDPKEIEKIAGKIAEQTAIVTALLAYCTKYFAVTVAAGELCDKYKVEHTY